MCEREEGREKCKGEWLGMKLGRREKEQRDYNYHLRIVYTNNSDSIRS